jgi:hypothetical protein
VFLCCCTLNSNATARLSSFTRDEADLESSVNTVTVVTCSRLVISNENPHLIPSGSANRRKSQICTDIVIMHEFGKLPAMCLSRLKLQRALTA